MLIQTTIITCSNNEKSQSSVIAHNNKGDSKTGEKEKAFKE